MPSDTATAPPTAASAASTDRLGCLIVISGPSGTGKTSICNELLRRLPGARWSVSATTRPRRSNELDGQSYRFVTPAEFQTMRERGEFLETAEYVGHQYGTPLGPVREAIAAGHPIVLEIEVQGGIQVAKKMPESIRIFVLPPTRESLEARLRGRRTESQEQVRKRLAQADGEIAAARDSGCYPYFVINDDLEETVLQVMDIVRKEVLRP